MNRYILTTIVSLFSLVTVILGLFHAQEAKPVTLDSEEESETIPVGFYLGKLAKKYDCFFTLEEAWEEGKARNEMEAYSVEKLSESKSFEEELEYLRLSIPYFSYEIRAGSPRITHIIDTRLMYREEYGVESVIKGIEFEGTVNNLVAAIGKKGILVFPEERFFIGGAEFPDRNTIVHVKGEGIKVRDALTNFIRLEGRDGRFLWIARTKLGKGEVTYIYYPLPGKMTKQ